MFCLEDDDLYVMENGTEVIATERCRKCRSAQKSQELNTAFNEADFMVLGARTYRQFVRVPADIKYTDFVYPVLLHVISSQSREDNSVTLTMRVVRGQLRKHTHLWTAPMSSEHSPAPLILTTDTPPVDGGVDAEVIYHCLVDSSLVVRCSPGDAIVSRVSLHSLDYRQNLSVDDACLVRDILLDDSSSSSTRMSQAMFDRNSNTHKPKLLTRFAWCFSQWLKARTRWCWT